MDLEKLSTLLVNLGSPHQYLVQDLGEPTVYHYTNLNALQGIVASQDLWLTNSRFSNDYEEGEHGARIIRKAIADRLDRPDLPKAQRDFARTVRNRLARAKDEGAYVCCFCRKDDLLGQWRSYGANGTGVSIGLETIGFHQACGPDLPREIGLAYLWRVFYEESQQHRIVDECIDLAFNQAGVKRADRIQLAVEAIRFFAPTFKNSDFEDEREARLVFRPAAGCEVKPRFRVGRGMLVPYYTIQDLAGAADAGGWRPPISSVRIGPSTNRAINRQGVELMLGSKGYKKVPVAVSQTPYRG